MPDYTNADLDRAQAKPRPKGHVPYPPDRGASLTMIRDWLSLAAGLPTGVRIDVVTRHGPDPADPIVFHLSNGMKLRCPHQQRLTHGGSLAYFFASESDGIAQPPLLNPQEVTDFFNQLCRLGSPAIRPDPPAELAERLAHFVDICQEQAGSLFPEHRYVTIEALRQRPLFDRSAAHAMRNGQPEVRPAVLIDTVQKGARYVRSVEFVAYLRFVVGWIVNESNLVGRMSEIGSERVFSQAWNVGRSHHVNLTFYALPNGSPAP